METCPQNSRDLSFAGFNAQMSANNVEMAEAKLREIIEEALEDGVIEPREQQQIDSAKETLDTLKKKEHNVNKKIVAMIASDMAADATNLFLSGATSPAQAKFEVSNSKMVLFLFPSAPNCKAAAISFMPLQQERLSTCTDANSFVLSRILRGGACLLWPVSTLSWLQETLKWLKRS